MLSSASLLDFAPLLACVSAVLLPAEAHFKAGDKGFALLLSMLGQAESCLFFLSWREETAFRCSTWLHSAHPCCPTGASTGREGALHPPDRSIVDPPAVRLKMARALSGVIWRELLNFGKLI